MSKNYESALCRRAFGRPSVLNLALVAWHILWGEHRIQIALTFRGNLAKAPHKSVRLEGPHWMTSRYDCSTGHGQVELSLDSFLVILMSLFLQQEGIAYTLL